MRARFPKLLLVLLLSAATLLTASINAPGKTDPANADARSGVSGVPEAAGDLTGAWNWTDTATTGEVYTGLVAIQQISPDAFFWVWGNRNGSGWGANVCTTPWSCSPLPSISGNSISFQGWSNDRGTYGNWAGIVADDGQAISGTWSQSDGLAGTFTAMRVPSEVQIPAGDTWKYSRTDSAGWEQAEFDDSAWEYAVPSQNSCGCLASMWAPNPVQGETIFLRRSFELSAAPIQATMFAAFDDDGLVYVNGTLVHTDSDGFSSGARGIDIAPFLHAGSNVIAMRATDTGGCQNVWTVSVVQTVEAPKPIERAVVFIQGIDSESRDGQSPTDCSSTTPGFIQDGEQQKAGWIADYLSDPAHVGGLSLQKDTNFFYFSYSGHYCLENGVQDFRRPIYAAGATCNGVGDAADKLQTVLAALIARYPQVKFDLVAHSMGGVVSAYWLAEHGDDQTAQGDMRSYIHSITTFDSPLRGLPQLIPGTVLVSPGTHCVDPVPSTSWEDMSCVYWGSANYCSPVVIEIASMRPTVPFFTLDATTPEKYWGSELLQAVDSERTTLAESDSALHCAVKDDHSSVWESKTITGSPPVGCWAGFHWTDDPPPPLLKTPNSDAKGAFVACAVSSIPASQCLDEIGTNYEPPAALPGPAPAGNTELQVSSSPFAIGDGIVLNPFMPNEEENRIVRFASLILASPLQFDHEAGEPIAIVSSPAVGGIAEAPDAPAGAMATKSRQSARITFAIAGFAAVGALVVLAGAGAWYSRRRWLRP